jgi:hypothetical protein
MLALLSNRRDQVELLSDVWTGYYNWVVQETGETHGKPPQCPWQTTLMWPSRMPAKTLSRTKIHETGDSPSPSQ